MFSAAITRTHAGSCWHCKGLVATKTTDVDLKQTRCVEDPLDAHRSSVADALNAGLQYNW
jgi:hypothetical protein